MYLTITTTRAPATDLGFLLHKHPERIHEQDVGFGKAIVFYPEATEARTTAALHVEVDPVGLVRGRAEGTEGTLDQYVNIFPYAASSFLSVAMSRLFGTALAGKSRQRPELAATPLPLTAVVHGLAHRGGQAMLGRLFEPLGYEVVHEPQLLDPERPDWGESRLSKVTLSNQIRLKELLDHLYVLIPVLDDWKHYYVGEAEVEKLLRHGAEWLSRHPEKDLITSRYLLRKPGLVRLALERLQEDQGDPDEQLEAAQRQEDAVEQPLRLHEVRLLRVLELVKESGAGRVLDLGCGEGKLLRLLQKDRQFTEIVGVDVSHRALETAARRLRLEKKGKEGEDRIKLLHGSLTYRDARLAGYDAAALVEVIEHLEPGRLRALERVVFEFARPRLVVITTPNVEFNVRFPDLPAGAKRHNDHRFEWTRAELQSWATAVGARHGYSVSTASVGPEDPEVGAPTQLAAFRRQD